MATSLKIIHCLRAPVGGLFRHVLDLARAQIAAGNQVGIIADQLTGGDAAAAKLKAIEPDLALGLVRVPMPRSIGLADFAAYKATAAHASAARADVLHGHGAKGGAYARLAARGLKQAGQAVYVLYTPHGGSLHYEPMSPQGLLFLGLERQLAKLTGGLIFESDYSRRIYEAKVGAPPCAVRVIPNGLLPADFTDHQPAPDARDVLFVGELRALKGVDVLLRALAQTTSPRPPTAIIVGTGPDEDGFKALSESLGLKDRVTFVGAMPAPQAFPLGRLLAVPSRAESFPYIVLEGAAAGLPMLLSSVGGIPEITMGTRTELLPAGDADVLSRRLGAFLANPAPFLVSATELKRRVASRFTVARMTGDIMDFYRQLRHSAEKQPAVAKILTSG